MTPLSSLTTKNICSSFQKTKQNTWKCSLYTYLNPSYPFLPYMHLFSAMSNSLQPSGLESAKFFCPWDSPRQEYWSIRAGISSSMPMASLNPCKWDFISTILLNHSFIHWAYQSIISFSLPSNPISSWQIDGGKVEAVTDFLFLVSKITTDSDCSH